MQCSTSNEIRYLKLHFNRRGVFVQNLTAVLPQSFRSNDAISGKLIRVGLGTLFLTASSWVSIPTVPIPTTMQTYAVLVIGAVFGARLGAVTVLAWLAEAMLGMPVLAHGAAGFAVFLGPSAGFLFSFPVAAAFVGWLADRKLDRSIAASALSMLAGNAINLSLGVLWLAAVVGWHRAVLFGFTPFWIGALIKAFLATATIWCVRNRRSKPAVQLP
jgi:biotin transport system substrate-specific component